MKKILTLLILITLDSFAQERDLYNIPDAEFMLWMKDNYSDLIVDDSLNITAASKITHMNISVFGYEVSDLDGLQHFPNLDTLFIEGHSIRIIPSLSNSHNLKKLRLWDLHLTTLPFNLLSGLNNLLSLSFQYQPFLTTLPDMSDLENLSNFSLFMCPKLESISGLSGSNNLTSLGVHTCESLSSLPNIYSLGSLETLSMLNTPLVNHISELPESLRSIQFFKTGIEIVPEIIHLTELDFLSIVNNINIATVPDIPVNLESVNIIENENLICIGSYPDIFDWSLGRYPKCSEGIINQLYEAFNLWKVSIDLQEGWNLFGYGCPEPIDLVQAMSEHTDNIIILKDNNGKAYMPEFGFNGIGDFTPGYGYQIKVAEAIVGISLCNWYENENIFSVQEWIVDMYFDIGCTDSLACNYDSEHLYDDGSCNYPSNGYDCEGNWNVKLGDNVFGGIVFNIDESGHSGRIVSKHDVPGSYQWGCDNEQIHLQNDIGSGYLNSFYLNEQCTISDNITTAVHASLSFSSDGYDDWYLPSSNELITLSEYIENNCCDPSLYWASSSDGDDNAHVVDLCQSTIKSSSKLNLFKVRPIRSF